MTKRILSVLAATAMLMAVGPLFTTTSAAELTCRIPFNFIVNGKAMPAGFYTISTRDAILVVSGTKVSAAALTKGLQTLKDGDLKVVFEKSGDRYVMREAWTGNGYGRELPRPNWSRDRNAAPNASIERVVIHAM